MMTSPPRGFENREYISRLEKVQRAMAFQNVDACLFSTEAEIRYYSGFTTQFWQSPTRPWFLVLPASGKPIAVIPSIGKALMRDCFIEDLQTWSSPEEANDGVLLLANTIKRQIGEKGRLGMMMGRETNLRMPLSDFHALRERLPNIILHDMTSVIQSLRMIKSPAEQNKLRYICEIVSGVFESIPEWVHEGMPLDELFRRFKQLALEAGVDDVSYLVGGSGPGGYSDIIAPPNDRPLMSGDIFMLDTGCVWDGYFCDFDRNFAIMYATDVANNAHNQLFDATEKALETLAPGIFAKDLFNTMHQSLLDNTPTTNVAGEVGRYGHGLGIQLTEPPSHTHWDYTRIREDMVLTLEPSIYYEKELIMVAEEDVLVKESGPQLLSRRAPRDLPVIVNKSN